MHSNSTLRLTILSLAIISLVTFIIYSNSLYGEFVFDDLTSILHHPVIKDPQSVANIWDMSHSRFIANLTFVVNYHFGETNVFFYHLINVTIHLLVGFSVFLLVKTLQETPLVKKTSLGKSLFLPFFASLVFVSHPVQTQAVSYIVQRTASLSALFYLLALIFFLQSMVKPSLLTFKITLAYFFSGLAFFTKENTFTLPFAILLANHCFFGTNLKKDKQRLLLILPFFLIAFLSYMAIKTDFFSQQTPPQQLLSLPSGIKEENISHREYLLTQINVVRTYIRLLFLPINLNLDYDYPISQRFFDRPTFASFLFLTSFLILGLWLYKRNRLISFGIFFFFFSLTIESGFIPLPDVIFEHRLYLPSVGFVISLSSFLFLLFNFLRPKVAHLSIIASFFLILVVSFLSFATFSRNYVWQTRLTLWQDVVSKSPKKARAHYNLGVALSYQDNLEQAKPYFEKAIKLQPKYINAYHSLATIYEDFGKKDKALEIYLDAKRLDSSNLAVRNSLGSFYAKQGKLDEAIAEYRFILEIDPENASAFNNLGVVYTQLDKSEEAIILLEKAIAINPNYENALFNLATAYFHAGRLDSAIQAYKQVLDLNPNSEKAYYSISVIYSQQNDLRSASWYFQKAIELNPSLNNSQKELEMPNE